MKETNLRFRPPSPSFAPVLEMNRVKPVRDDCSFNLRVMNLREHSPEVAFASVFSSLLKSSDEINRKFFKRANSRLLDLLFSRVYVFRNALKFSEFNVPR
jgi:hypothetical protein